MEKMRFALGVAAVLLSVAASQAQTAEPDGGGIRQGKLLLAWNTGGPKCMEMPEWQVHEYNPDLFILRQSGCTDYEKPFLYLLFGKERALLLDTGSRHGNLVPALQHTVHQWLLRNNRESIPLIVAHSHSHSDHVAGDAELQALKDPAMPIVLTCWPFRATTPSALRYMTGRQQFFLPVTVSTQVVSTSVIFLPSRRATNAW